MIKRQTSIKLLILTIAFITCTQCVKANETEQAGSVGNENIINTQSAYQTERRNYIRFNNKAITFPVDIKSDKNLNLIDISRDGVRLEHNNNLSAGDIVPITIQYKEIIINTPVEIIESDNKCAGGKFIPQDKEVLNKLLYLSIILEFDNGLLVTRLKEG